VRLARAVEAGALVDAVALDDLHRTGGPSARPGVLAAVGALVDARLGAWQLDVRAGYCPTPGGGFGAFASLGWAFARRH
jgi:hypothetical protein